MFTPHHDAIIRKTKPAAEKVAEKMRAERKHLSISVEQCKGGFFLKFS